MTPIYMDDSGLRTVEEVQKLLESGERVRFSFQSKTVRNEWMSDRFSRFNYAGVKCPKKNKQIVLSYIEMVTGLSRPQIKRYAKRKKRTGKVERIDFSRNSFPVVYGPEEIARLIETDNAHARMSGEATKKVLEREYSIFGNGGFEVIRHVSVSYLYLLRKKRQYESHSLFLEKTKAVNRDVGERRKPVSGGLPGYIRVDSVHQGDLEKEKGVYYINMVDEVTQFEIIGCVEGISEQFLLPLLEKLIIEFPFVIRGFHSDNGSEYINHVVETLLQKLMIDQTKSRSGKTTDNAQVEGKNASRVRKVMGHGHIPKRFAESINEFCGEHLNIYNNFHRPCGFATKRIDEKGKVKKKYDVYETPFRRLAGISNVTEYLKPGVTIISLTAIELRESDNECGKKLQKARGKLFESFTKC